MWFNLISMGLKTGAKLYSDKQKFKTNMSEAKLLQSEKMRKGEIEYKGKVFENQKEIGKMSSFYLYCHPLCFF